MSQCHILCRSLMERAAEISQPLACAGGSPGCDDGVGGLTTRLKVWGRAAFLPNMHLFLFSLMQMNILEAVLVWNNNADGIWGALICIYWCSQGRYFGFNIRGIESSTFEQDCNFNVKHFIFWWFFFCTSLCPFCIYLWCKWWNYNRFLGWVALARDVYTFTAFQSPSAVLQSYLAVWHFHLRLYTASLIFYWAFIYFLSGDSNIQLIHRISITEMEQVTVGHRVLINHSVPLIGEIQIKPSIQNAILGIGWFVSLYLTAVVCS